MSPHTTTRLYHTIDMTDTVTVPVTVQSLQHTATHCNTLQLYHKIDMTDIVTATVTVQSLQHTATHCNTLQHTATVTVSCDTVV